MNVVEIIAAIDEQLESPPPNPLGGSLMILVGLPGTGKSVVASALQKRLPHVLVSTDTIRRVMTAAPSYSDEEKAQIYQLCFEIIERRLRRGQRVLFDAVNQLQIRRDQAAAVAVNLGLPAMFCYFQASPEAIKERLVQRNSANRRLGDMSDADWAVYNLLVETQEPMTNRHLILDSSSTSPEALADCLHAYWLKEEAAQWKRRSSTTP